MYSALLSNNRLKIEVGRLKLVRPFKNNERLPLAKETTVAQRTVYPEKALLERRNINLEKNQSYAT